MSTVTGNGVVTVTSLGQFAQGARTRSSSFWASSVGQELLRQLGPTALLFRNEGPSIFRSLNGDAQQAP
ncbi:MAG TPA: hypothetical protein VKU02_07015 [Gemmataceae bacterium]|nr:hypothetical protein [Gemmataceae bacterium]